MTIFFFFVSGGEITVLLNGTPQISVVDPSPVNDLKYVSFGTYGDRGNIYVPDRDVNNLVFFNCSFSKQPWVKFMFKFIVK